MVVMTTREYDRVILVLTVSEHRCDYQHSIESYCWVYTLCIYISNTQTPYAIYAYIRVVPRCRFSIG